MTMSSERKDLQDQQQPVVSQAILTNQSYNRKQHITDADKKPIQELLKNMLDDVPGAYFPCILRMEFRRPEDYLFLMKQFETIQEEEKTSQKSGEQLSVGKLYFLASINNIFLGNDSLTKHYCERAASLGHAGALLMLGIIVDKDSEHEAAKYYEKAAEKGDYQAQARLGFYYIDLYRRRFNLFSNTYLESAEQYYQRAVHQGFEDALCWVGAVSGLGGGEQAPLFYRQATETYQLLYQLGHPKGKKSSERQTNQFMRMAMLDDSPSSIYHSTMGIAHLMKSDKKIKLSPELLSAFGKLASDHSNQFLALCKTDPWENVFPLLPAATAKRLMELDASLKLPAEFVRAEGDSKEQPKENARMTAPVDLKDQPKQEPNSGNQVKGSVATASTSLWEPLHVNGNHSGVSARVTAVGQWKRHC